MRRPLAPLALALLILLAGCNAGVGGAPTPTAETTAAPVPTDTPTATPERKAPGLTLNGIVDGDRLARAHELALRGANYSYTFEGARRAEGRTVASYTGTLRATPNCDTYSYTAYQPRPRPSRLTQSYANGSVALSRSFAVNLSATDPDTELVEPAPTVVTVDGEPADPCAVRPFDPTRSATMHALYGNLSFVVSQRFDGFVLTATNGTLDSLRLDAGGVAHNVTVRTARIQLAESGRVRSAFISYTGTFDGRRVEGTVSFRYRLDDDPVTPPWPANATA